jgi:hypothetical protein
MESTLRIALVSGIVAIVLMCVAAAMIVATHDYSTINTPRGVAHYCNKHTLRFGELCWNVNGKPIK